MSQLYLEETFWRAQALGVGPGQAQGGPTRDTPARRDDIQGSAWPSDKPARWRTVDRRCRETRENRENRENRETGRSGNRENKIKITNPTS